MTVRGGAVTFKVISQYGGREDFLKSLRASPFWEDLSINTTFSQIHLAASHQTVGLIIQCTSVIIKKFTVSLYCFEPEPPKNKSYALEVFWRENPICLSL